MSSVHPSVLILSFCLGVVAGNDAVSIGVSNNPTYDKQPVTFTCGFPAFPYVGSASLLAFNGSTAAGSLKCGGTGQATTGIFMATVLVGCTQQNGLQNLNATLTASNSLELDYLCSIVYTNPGLPPANSTIVHLQINVAPSPPQLFPTVLVFNDSDRFTISCIALGGSPVANLSLTIRQESSSSYLTAQNISSVGITETASKKWHNATVTCLVQNHNIPNMTTTGLLQVNYIYLHTSPQPVSTASGNVTLYCPDFVESFPQSTYVWSTPPAQNLDASSNGSLKIVVPQGQGGLFNCTASNTVTGKSVTVTFAVTSNVIVSSSPTATPWNNSTDVIIGVVVAVAIVIIVVIVVLVVLYRRGHFTKRKPSDKPRTTYAQSEGVSGNSYGDEQMRDNNLYAAASPNSHDDDPAVGVYDNLSGRPDDQPSSATNTAAVKQQQDRLLIAAAGLTTNLKHKVLRSTCLVEFSEHSSSLTAILDAIRRAVSAQRQFKHVALLLRPTDEGPLLSRPDGQVINSSTVSSNKHLRNFLLSLAKLCLDQSGGDASVDLLNDVGAGGSHLRSELHKALEDLLKVPASVSGDMYGVSTVIDQNNGTVGDLYFDRHRLDDVVYAEIVMPKQPRQPAATNRDDRVVYSEVRALKPPPRRPSGPES